MLMLVLCSVFSLNISYAQEGGEKEKPTVEELKDRIDGIDESVNALITDVSGLKKIKVSGYMQIQFDKTEANRSFTMSPYDSSDFDQSRFRVRRSRLKVTYDAGLTQYVLQGDFSNTGFSLKDAYIKITDPWLQYFSLQTGVFNRPAYEVEYSSSQRESMERSKIISTLYPGERDLGAMLIVNPDEMFKFQFAAFNNTFKGTFSQADPNFNNEPLYYMARLIKEFALTDLGLGIDLGVHARFGNAIANTNSVLESDKGTKAVPDSSSVKKGDAIGRNWFGVEAQIYYDFLGGMKIMGEYIMGSNVDEFGTAAKPASIRKRDFSGFYVMLVKNITEQWQFAAKYDSYNPNTKIAESDVDNANDLAFNTIGLGIHNYSFDNVRLSLWYDINKRAENVNVKGFETSPINNLLTVRFQYKF